LLDKKSSEITSLKITVIIYLKEKYMRNERFDILSEVSLWHQRHPKYKKFNIYGKDILKSES
jgi:hypothetical protein